MNEKKPFFDIKICVSGAAEASHFGQEAYEKGKAVGGEIVKQGAVLLTGATTGFPYWASLGAKEQGGLSIGFSPAISAEEHKNAYRLPLDSFDLIVYTGFGYPGRDLILTRSVDAVIIGPGRIGTFHEFTIAYEDEKPIGVLEGEWQTDEIIKSIIENSHRPSSKIIFDKDPKRLVERIFDLIAQDRKLGLKKYRNYDGVEGGNPDSASTMYYSQNK